MTLFNAGDEKPKHEESAPEHLIPLAVQLQTHPGVRLSIWWNLMQSGYMKGPGHDIKPKLFWLLCN